MNSRSYLSKDAMILGVLLFFLLFQNLLSLLIGPFQYCDELYAVMFFPLLILFLTREGFQLQLRKSSILIFVLLILFSICGFVGVFRYHYQPMRISIMDWFLHMKFFLAIAATYCLFAASDMDQLYKELWKILKPLIIGLFLLFIADYVLHIFPAKTRFGLRAEAMIFGTPGGMAFVMVGLSAFLFRLYEYYRGKILLYQCMVWIMMLSTLRAKSFGGVVVAVFIYCIIIKRRRTIGFLSWMTMGASVLLLANKQFTAYYSTNADKAVRHILQKFSFRIANDYFPFGTGFGTYASAYSADPYSRIYIRYHLDHIWGMSRTYYAFISDTFWPMIIGQSGYLGLLVYLLLILLLLFSVFRISRKNAYSYASALLLMIYFLISTTCDSAFVNPNTVLLAVPLGLLFAENSIFRNSTEEGST